LLNHFGIPKPTEYFFTESCGRQSNYVLYECWIQIPVEIVTMYALPAGFVHKTYSMKAVSKTLADESASANCLSYFDDHPPPPRPNIARLSDDPARGSVGADNQPVKRARCSGGDEDEDTFSNLIDEYTFANNI
jgi:hypothetical protein